MFSKNLEDLIDALARLPSIGQKTAQRLAFYILQEDRQAGLTIASALEKAVESIGHCKFCRNFSEQEICLICTDKARNNQTICIVESPIDVVAIEQSVYFKGKYFVLMGKLSPLDGLGPEEIGLSILEARLQNMDVEELILATNITVEGDATAFYIAEMAKKYQVKTSRIAFGVPMGGEIEYIDRQTLGHAFDKRSTL